jgi:hypothetical protein
MLSSRGRPSAGLSHPRSGYVDVLPLSGSVAELADVVALDPAEMCRRTHRLVCGPSIEAVDVRRLAKLKLRHLMWLVRVDQMPQETLRVCSQRARSCCRFARHPLNDGDDGGYLPGT